MRLYALLLALFSCSHAHQFKAPTAKDVVQYGDSVDVVIRLTANVVNGRIAWGRTPTEALRASLTSFVQAYIANGDFNLRIGLPKHYTGGEIADTAYQGWITLYFLAENHTSLAFVPVYLGTPPVSGAGKVPRAIARPGKGRSTLVDIMGRNRQVTPTFYWRLPYGF